MLEILLVEDNEGDVHMTQRALRDASAACNLSVVNDGAEAMELLLKQKDFSHVPTPQLILLDLNMPRMDGKEFLETIKSHPQLKAIPVVMLTSSGSPSDIKDCYERHASCYVIKPFDGQEFMGAVRKIIYFWNEVGQLGKIKISI